MRLLLLAGLVAQCGCAYALQGASSRGADFPFERAADVGEGMTQAEVLAILGEPVVQRETTTSATSEQWYYYHFEAERSCNVYLFGFLRVRRAPSTTEEIEIRFDSGLVSAMTARSVRGFRKPKYDLPPPAESRPGRGQAGLG